MDFNDILAMMVEELRDVSLLLSIKLILMYLFDINWF